MKAGLGTEVRAKLRHRRARPSRVWLAAMSSSESVHLLSRRSADWGPQCIVALEAGRQWRVRGKHSSDGAEYFPILGRPARRVHGSRDE